MGIGNWELGSLKMVFGNKIRLRRLSFISIYWWIWVP